MFNAGDDDDDDDDDDDNNNNNNNNNNKLVFLSIPLLTFEGLPRWISSFSTCKAHSSLVGFSLLIVPSR